MISFVAGVLPQTAIIDEGGHSLDSWGVKKENRGASSLEQDWSGYGIFL
jgi:hypothetical protein